MKKIALFFGLLALNLTTYAALPTEAGEFEVNVPMLKSGLELGADVLFVKSSTPELDYALVFPDGTSDGARYKSARPSHDVGYQFYLGYISACSGTDLRLVYSEYEQRERDHVGVPEGTILPALAPLFTGPVQFPAIIVDFQLIEGSGVIDFVEVPIITPALTSVSLIVIEADVKNTIRQGSIDLEAGQYINVDNFMRLRLFGGLRYSRIKNQLVATYLLTGLSATETQTSGPFVFFGENIFLTTTATFTSPSTIQEVVSQTSKFDGIGPRFGVEGTFHLGGGFGLVGSLSTAMLVGESQSSLSKRLTGTFDTSFTLSPPVSSDPAVRVNVDELISPTNPFPIVISDIENFDHGKKTRIVPNLQAKIGFDYTTALKHCRFISLEVGYFVNHYFQVVDRLSATSLDQAALNAENIQDIGFSGPYIELRATL